MQVLIDAVGKAEQLVRTPVPQAYSHHTSRFLTMWTVTRAGITGRRRGYART